MNQVTLNNNRQTDILLFAEEHGDWFTSEDVCKKLDIGSRVVAAKFLRKLWKYSFLERRKKFESVELEYRII
jgi:hypothetical protein